METVRLRKCFQEVQRWGRERRRSWKPSKVCSGLFITCPSFSVSNLTPCTCWSAVLSHAAVITVYRNLEPRSNGFEIVPIPLHTWSFCRHVALLSTEREEARWRHKEQLRTVLDYIGSAYSYFEDGCRKKLCTRQSRKVFWDMINTLFLTL